MGKSGGNNRSVNSKGPKFIASNPIHGCVYWGELKEWKRLSINGWNIDQETRLRLHNSGQRQTYRTNLKTQNPPKQGKFVEHTTTHSIIKSQILIFGSRESPVSFRASEFLNNEPLNPWALCVSKHHFGVLTLVSWKWYFETEHGLLKTMFDWGVGIERLRYLSPENGILKLVPSKWCCDTCVLQMMFLNLCVWK